MTWTVVPPGLMAPCGACGQLIPEAAPMALLTSARLIRCASCAGEPMDDVQLDLERRRLEQARQARDVPAPASTAAPVRVPRSRRVQPWSAVADLIPADLRLPEGDRE